MAIFNMLNYQRVGHLLHRGRGAQTLPAALGLPSAPERYCARADAGELSDPWRFHQMDSVGDDLPVMFEWFSNVFSNFLVLVF